MKWRRHFAIMLVATLLFACLVPSSHAEEMTSKDEEAYKQELPELREANKKYYALSDGTYQCVVYSQRVHFLNETGAFEDIDNTLLSEEYQSDTTSYAWRNARNDFLVRFSETAREGTYPIRIERGNAIIEFGYECTNNASAEVYPKAIPTLLKGVADPLVSVNYADVFANTDMLYTVSPSGVKEFIVIKDSEAEGVYRFKINVQNASIQEQGNKIVFVDSTGEAFWEITPFFATDSADHYCDDIEYTLEKQADGTFLLEIQINTEWLHEEERAFPVILDPSVIMSGSDETYDTFVSSLYPSSNYYLDYYLRTGKDDDYGIRRALLKFDLPSRISGSQVDSAFIRVKKYDGDTPNLFSYKITGAWSSSGATWNNKPGYSSGSETAFTYDTDNWYEAVATLWTKNWLSGGYANYGVYLKDSNESSTSHWARFYSSDSSYPNRPELVINYTKPGIVLLSFESDGSNTRSGYMSSVKATYTGYDVACTPPQPYHYSDYSSSMKATIIDYLTHHDIVYIHAEGGARTVIPIGTSAYLSMSDLSSTNLSVEKVAILLSGYSAQGGYTASNVSNNTPYNLVERFRVQGTSCVVGFTGYGTAANFNGFAERFTDLAVDNHYTIASAALNCQLYSDSSTAAAMCVVGGSGNLELP